ncbi:tRNA-modifying protein YgfZ [Buchnera aphidicola (Macrosiphoniella sanborni)]|uniref:tRNA-modifying protein YgfZ n=1 Tax=Buchnera aphidicola (Macrosiphoniella sanborni) TaxID=1241865 RepID=A0A4D6Y5Y4_9GAMM|nr:tRNA-modifying protein YgfZ [Buchnera aphidicola]QCI23953.1 tRNA-modifying protein YgfZ [Buchnera aphidicola (Macrosiphoniella sanborni)]
MSSFILLQDVIYLSNQLSLTMILLKEWSLVYVSGVDSKKYLQNQLTIDMNMLLKTQHTLCAHCNINGKVWSTMRLFHYQKGYAYIQRKTISKIQIKEIQKYSIFSKIQFHELNNIVLIGFAGFETKSFLLTMFIKIPNKNCPVIHQNNITLLWYSEPSERFLLIFSVLEFELFKNKINKKIFFNNSKQWLSLEIEAGFPVIDAICSKKFTPQAINLDLLNAINFNKGCYYGQEIIARIFFKNSNKYFLYSLISMENIFPKIGSCIEVQINKKWLKIGVLLSFVNIKYDKTYIQVVLDKSVNIDSSFRVYGFKNIFFKRNKVCI